MRIGIDCRAYGPSHGYMGRYIEHLVSCLIENEGTDEYVLFFGEREWSDFTMKSPRFRTVKTSAKIGGLREQILFPYELSKEKLDLMLFSSPNIPLFYFGKSIIILSDLVSYFYPEKRLKGIWMRYWQSLILRQSIQKSSSIIVFSEVLKRDIIEISDTHEEKIRIIPPMCLDIIPQSETEAKQFLSKEGLDREYILSVGELREYKNIPRLLQAYSLLLKEDNIDIDLVLVGKEDSTYHEIRSTLISLGLQSRVHIYNVLDEDKIGYLYQNASLYILPSLYEGSEEAVLTPLSYGLPIASSSLPCIIAALGKNGATFFRPMSIPEMKEALRKSFSSSSPKGGKTDMSMYSLSSVSAKILDIFSLYRKDTDTEMPPISEEKTNL
ncbi:MAG: glycosyltransferase family 1 protein [Candidatus Gracilibacteria bacterium]|nr:glycosyltransferase family 1 protein [Candidatus Gracilibacteria bacterium]